MATDTDHDFSRKEVGPSYTSPRKLQEMMPGDSFGDITSSSGINMKQYEDQLNSLKNQNFQLKLRIFFLEEKLGNGAPPPVQGLLEHNVRLQVEVAELKRQLTEKQQLLAAAAEAIGALEQQSATSMNNVDQAAISNQTNYLQLLKEKNAFNTDSEVNEPVDNNKTAPPNLAVTIGTSELANMELEQMQKKQSDALVMIKNCVKKINLQEKQIKKLLQEKEAFTTQASDSNIDRYEEILKKKDDLIQDLETKLKEVQHITDTSVDSSRNVQELLTRRLQGVAFFLDKLLSNKCVLGEDKQRLAESLLEQSLALPVGLQLDESLAPGDFTMDDSALDVSQALRLEDLTAMFGHHGIDDNTRVSIRNSMKSRNGPRKLELLSESECWSEPDRNVSLARIGLREVSRGSKVSSSDDQCRKSKKTRSPRSDESKLEIEELEQLRKEIHTLRENEVHLNDKIHKLEQEVNALKTERDDLSDCLIKEKDYASELRISENKSKHSLELATARYNELEARLALALQENEKLSATCMQLEVLFAEKEAELQQSFDEAQLEASREASGRAQAQHEKLVVERELEEVRLKLIAKEDEMMNIMIGIGSEEERPTSPDQGIDSDRLSSLEQPDSIKLSPRSLYSENLSLKKKLEKMTTTLMETLNKLNAANKNKVNMQRAICREIHKTNGVLRKARDQFESKSHGSDKGSAAERSD